MKKLVVLTGAGISAESGLKTFRDSDGLWEGYNIEDVATPQAWHKDPALVLEFYNYRRKNVADASPNKAHYILADLENYFDVHIITQNIDDLHERGGSSRVLHLHGEIFKMRSSISEDLVYPIYDDINIGDLADDGHQLRPHIVWFGESVPLIENAASLTSHADLFAVVGTSLVVYPAAGLIHATKPGTPCFIVDKKIPQTTGIRDLVELEMPATSGMEALREILIRDYSK
jgi:NAD-dependent deacetylase